MHLSFNTQAIRKCVQLIAKQIIGQFTAEMLTIDDHYEVMVKTVCFMQFR